MSKVWKKRKFGDREEGKLPRKEIKTSIVGRVLGFYEIATGKSRDKGGVDKKKKHYFVRGGNDSVSRTDWPKGGTNPRSVVVS